jgi:hypothetical protein
MDYSPHLLEGLTPVGTGLAWYLEFRLLPFRLIAELFLLSSHRTIIALSIAG